MTTNQRIALIAAALVVAVLAFVIAQPGDDEDDADNSATTTPAQTETGSETTPDDTATVTEEEPPPPEPVVARIRLVGGVPEGGVKDIEVERGEDVRIIVTADSPDDIHLHGYDIERQAAPGQPARFRFKADAEGAFEIESHVAEDAGRDPLIARLVVSPS